MSRPGIFARPGSHNAFRRNLARFARSQRGAVTIDYVPIAGAMIGLGIVVVATITMGSRDMGDTTGDRLSEVNVFEIMRGDSDPGDTGGGSGGDGSWNDDLPPVGFGADTFVPGQGNGSGGSNSGLGDGTNPGQGSDNNNAGDTPGGTGTDNPGGSDAGDGDMPDTGGDAGAGDDDGASDGCQGNAGVSCSGLGDDTNPGQGSDNNDAGDTPGGTGVTNPNQSGNGGVPDSIDHTFPTQVIPANWGDWRDTTGWVDLQHLTGGQPAAFEVWGDGDPAFRINGVDQTEGFLQWGAQISMDTPPVPGTSNTAYIQVTVGETIWTAAYTITREGGPDAQPPAPPAPVASYVENVNIPYYWNNRYQNWFNRPSEIPANEWNGQPFTVSGDGNPQVQSNQGGWRSEGTMRWNGISMRFDTPPPGETYSIEVEFGDHIGVYTFTRAAAP